MSWNQPQVTGQRPGQPQQQQPVDPWASSFMSTSAGPTSSAAWPSSTSATNTSSMQYPTSSAQSQWGSTSYQQQQQPTQSSAQNQWASAPSTAAWGQQPAPASAWPAPAPAPAAATSWGSAPVSQPRAAPQPAPPANPWGQTSSWSAAPTSSAPATSAWTTSSAAPQWPETTTTSAWGNTSALNTSTSQWGGATGSSFSQSRAQPTAGVPNPFSYNDPFAAPSAQAPQQSMMNTSYSNVNNASFQSASSFNPFDVTNDDAGFFSSKPAAASTTANRSQLQKQSSSSAKEVPPPSATTQRLMRVASMLFERGLIIKADKMLIQDMVLRGEKRAEKALEVAERDGTLQDLHAAILHERKREANGTDSSEDEDERAEAAAASFKKRPSIGGRKNSDDDDDQQDALDVSRRTSVAVGKEGVSAPHPAAGGYTGNVPPEMGIQKGQFVGTILMRVSSKKMFRKWKPVFFALDLPRVVIYENRREWEMGAAPKFVIPLHECMWIAKPTLKKTYSLIDDGRRVYYSTLKENSPSVVGQAAMSGMERPTAFSPALEARVVAKFGSYYPDEISAFAHAIYSVVLAHQKEVKASLANAKGSSFRRTTSGFGS